MAHSYVQAHESEREAFREFARLNPETVLLVDTYDTLAGIRQVVRLARELGEGFRVHAVRLDSGELGELAREGRRILDEGGLDRVRIFASGGLDEDTIASLVAGGAPIDAFGVGSAMGVSADAPFLDCAYKLVEYGGRGRIKLSPGKRTLPGRKQVFRLSRGAEDVGDVIGVAADEPEAIAAWAGEGLEAAPLLVPVMRAGRRLPGAEEGITAAAERARSQTARLPGRVRALDPADPAYAVRLSPALEAEAERVRVSVGGAPARASR